LQLQQNQFAGLRDKSLTMSLEELAFENDANQTNSILNIEFSCKGQVMVVSYGSGLMQTT